MTKSELYNIINPEVVDSMELKNISNTVSRYECHRLFTNKRFDIFQEIKIIKDTFGDISIHQDQSHIKDDPVASIRSIVSV